MSLQETLKRIIRELGREVLQKPELLAVLEDYQAYADEGPATRAIVQQLIRSGAVRSLVMARRSEAGLHPQIRQVVTQTAELGFQEAAVSEILKSIILASGKISSEAKWPKVLNPQKTPNLAPAKEILKKPSAWKRLNKWLKLNFADVLVIPFWITAMCTVVTLSLTCFAFFFDPAEVSYWTKEFLICLISTIVIFITYCFTDR